MRPELRRRLLLRLFILSIILVGSLLKPRLDHWLGDTAPTERGQGDRASVPASAGTSGLPAEMPTLEIRDPADHLPAERAEAASGADQLPQQPTQPAASGSAAGQLRDRGGRVLESPAGLQYLPGSADGHRLQHVLRHATDDPDRPVHGVFDGDREQIVALLDEAFRKARSGGRDVRRERQADREVLTVRLNRRVGYVGGAEGRRQGHPECRCVRLVLEDGNVVISAYPTRSL